MSKLNTHYRSIFNLTFLLILFVIFNSCYFCGKMLKTTLKLTPLTKNVLSSCKANMQTSNIIKEKWDLLTAVLVERKPLICPEITGIEQDFKEYLTTVEFEKSLKSDIEIKLEKERSEKSQKKQIDDLDVITKQSTQDFLDACKEELATFEVSKRITKADKANDIKSLQRKLDKSLVLLVNQKVGEKSFYLLPQGKLNDGETLRQCAERIFKEKCGPNVKVQIFGNAPCGFYKYMYPKKIRNESSTGAKIFIYFARYSSGQITGTDFKWLDKNELNQILPEDYKKSVLPILLD
ncbi:large ribosomal subunit protein mL46 [Euwallacea fornicatus]|uniref:large ribosomal subunit protein mL46 n=1 Tax=Euwallacea fornicatus TaxID=995702 RepID=UPI00338DB636